MKRVIQFVKSHVKKCLEFIHFHRWVVVIPACVFSLFELLRVGFTFAGLLDLLVVEGSRSDDFAIGAGMGTCLCFLFAFGVFWVALIVRALCFWFEGFKAKRKPKQ